MRVRDVMTKGIQACHREDTVAEATTRMWKSECDQIPVIDWEGGMLGQISSGDVQAALERTGRPAAEIQVSEAMSHATAACSVEDEIDEALHVMRESALTSLPVVDQDRKLIGVLTIKSLLARKELGDDLGISESDLLKYCYGDL